MAQSASAPGASHGLVAIERCPITHKRLVSVLARLRDLSVRLDCLKQGGEWLLTLADNGVDLLLKAKELTLKDRQLAASAMQGSEIVRLARQAKANNKPETILQFLAPQITIAGQPVELPPASFLQATSIGEQALQDFTLARIEQGSRVADLFAGLGTFSLALMGRCKSIQAFEIDDKMVKALRRASHRRIDANKQNLTNRPVLAREFKQFDTAILDPPRRGAIDQVREMASSSLGSVIYASCDPGSFARDARILCDAGFSITTMLPIDQFLYSSAIEMIAHFERT